MPKWTRRTYDALHDYAGTNRARAIEILINAGHSKDVATLLAADNLGVWYRMTCEAARDLSPRELESSAHAAERELSAICR